MRAPPSLAVQLACRQRLWCPLGVQVQKATEQKDKQVADLDTRNLQLTKKLEATHSELSQKVFEAQQEAEKVAVWASPTRVDCLCCGRHHWRCQYVRD